MTILRLSNLKAGGSCVRRHALPYLVEKSVHLMPNYSFGAGIRDQVQSKSTSIVTSSHK
jgi:hypothetical protein